MPKIDIEHIVTIAKAVGEVAVLSNGSIDGSSDGRHKTIGHLEWCPKYNRWHFRFTSTAMKRAKTSCCGLSGTRMDVFGFIARFVMYGMVENSDDYD